MNRKTSGESMKTISVFVPTEECRQVKKDEWYNAGGESILKWSGDSPGHWEHDVLALTDIPVPEGAEDLIYGFYTKFSSDVYQLGIPLKKIPLSRPKVKKWKWCLGDLWITKNHFTQEEMDARANSALCALKLIETEIEE